MNEIRLHRQGIEEPERRGIVINKTALLTALVLTILTIAISYLELSHSYYSAHPLSLGIPTALTGSTLLTLLVWSLYKPSIPEPILPPPAPPLLPPSSLPPPPMPTIVPPREPPPPPPITLPRLTEEQRNATFGASPFHSARFHELIRNNNYHGRGDTWENALLAELFREGLLKHYIGTLVGHGFNPNYSLYQLLGGSDFSWDATYYGIEPFSIEQRNAFFSQFCHWDPRSSTSTLGSYADFVLRIMERFSNQPNLLKLGADHQRDKIVLEKYPQRGILAEEEYKEVLELDAKAERRQTVIYYWTKDFIEKVKAFFSKPQDPSTLDADAFPLALPDFFQNPLYQQLLSS